ETTGVGWVPMRLEERNNRPCIVLLENSRKSLEFIRYG
ncbi:uncharacterized protein METZ01_LOCUS485350, partial [marine metagenome]